MSKRFRILVVLLFSLTMVIAACTTISVRLTYQTNGGEAIPFETVDQGHVFGDLPEPTRVGHTFLGWYEDETFETIFDPTQPLNRNRVIYAKWEVNQYTLTFVLGIANPIAPRSYDYNALLNIEVPVLEGHTFLGWFTDEAMTKPFSENRMAASDLTIYAKWVAHQYTVNFYVDGVLFTSRTVTYGETITNLPSVPQIEGKQGFWDVDDFSNINEDMEVNAIYEDIYYTVIIEDTDGFIFNQQEVKYGELVSIPAEQPSKVGHTFIGYSEDLNTYVVTADVTIGVIFQVMVFTVEFYDQLGSLLLRVSVEYGETPTPPTVHVQEGFEFQGWDQDYVFVEEDLEINAIVEPLIYQIDFNALEGMFESGLSIRQVNAAYQSVLGLQEEPTLDGFEFIGWFDNDSLEGEQIVFGPQSTMPLHGLTLYAKWAPLITVSGNYHFERESLETTEIENDGESSAFGYAEFASYQQVIPAFEGYAFSHFVKDDVTYTQIEDLDLLTDLLDLAVYYRRLIVTMTFIQNPESAGGSSGIIEEIIRLYYNDNYEGELPHIIVTDGQYTARWDRTIFNQVKEDLTVRAMYYIVGVQTITFVDGGAIKFIASLTSGASDQILTASSPIWTLAKPGYRFLGWFTAALGGEKLEIEDLKFSLFAGSQNVYAQWVELESFQVVSDIVVELVDEETISLTWTQDVQTIEGVKASHYIVVLNGFEIIVDSDLVEFVNSNAILEITSEHPLFGAFSTLYEPGVHGLSIRVVGDNENHLSSPFSATYFHSVDTEIEGDVTDVAIYDYFIIEDVEIGGQATRRYVFYTDMTYHFSNRYTFEIIQGHDLITADTHSLIIGGTSGNFRFTMSVDGGNAVMYEGRVVESIRQFGLGANIQTYLSEVNANNYLSDEDTPYYVGSLNPYYLDLRMIDNKGERIALEDVLLVYEIYLNDEVVPLSGSLLDEYVTLLPENKMQFTESAEGQSFRLVVRPRYQAHMMQVDDVEFTIVVNKAHNAFTNAQLKSLFANMDVNTINIHANITAQLNNNQLNSDGSPLNINGNPETGQTFGNVYGRANSQTNDETFIVNGNFMTINGSNLPYSNASSGSGTVGYSASFEIVSVQIAIFYYNVLNSAMVGVNNNHFMMHNLTIIGNTTTPTINYGLSAEEIASQEQLMSRNSGGYNGVIVRNGRSTMHNLRIGYTLIALTNNAYGIQDEVQAEPIYMEVNDVAIYDNWANSIFVWGGTGVILNRSSIGQSGGAAIHLVDVRTAQGVSNPTVMIDQETIINNWISGEEAWFKAYAMSVVALQLKSLIEQSIAPLGKSIIREIDNPITGLPTQMINFILLTEPHPRAVDNDLAPTTGSENRLILTDEVQTTTIERSFNYLSQPTDPRVTGMNFLFPVGPLSPVTSFMAAVAEAMGYGLPQANAVNVAYIAGFYNLTVLEVLYMLTEIPLPFPEAVAMMKGADHAMPKYLEVLAPVPVFDSGYSIVLVEVFNQGS
jgi:uncharacterized repeat protein (TIGR02543 family)